uniref:Uncharacterized protein n=1 Tax=Stomoxys calcitrans TaxID=35570 RepID=A0A1I8PJY1_STOCA
MHSVQSGKNQLKLRSRQRRRRTTAVATACKHASSATAKASSPLYAIFSDKSVPKAANVVHGIVVSNLSLVLLQKEYIEQFYFEKRSGGGGPEDPDIEKLGFVPAANGGTCNCCHLMPDLRYG